MVVSGSQSERAGPERAFHGASQCGNGFVSFSAITARKLDRDGAVGTETGHARLHALDPLPEFSAAVGTL
jgi:hypothetical protein